jgi:hypothetical protein
MSVQGSSSASRGGHRRLEHGDGLTHLVVAALTAGENPRAYNSQSLNLGR